MSDYKLTKEQEEYINQLPYSREDIEIIREGFEKGISIKEMGNYWLDEIIRRSDSPSNQNRLHWAMLNAQLDICSGEALDCIKDVAQKNNISLDAFDEKINYQKLYEQIRSEADQRSTWAYESGLESLGEELDNFSSYISYERRKYGINPDVVVTLDDEEQDEAISLKNEHEDEPEL